MQTVTLAGYPEIARLIKIAASGYKKRKAFIQSREKITLSNTYWDGGSRSSYTVVTLSTGQITPCPQYSPPEFGGFTPSIAIDNDTVIIETGIFCGKTATASVYVSPENYSKFLKLS